MSLDIDFNNLTNLVRKVILDLETKSDASLRSLEKECKEEYISSAKTLEKFRDLITGISETCSGLLSNSEAIKKAAKAARQKNVLSLPSEIKSDVVECVSELYNMSLLEINKGEEKIVNEKNKEILSSIIKECEKNTLKIKDVEDAVIEATDIV